MAEKYSDQQRKSAVMALNAFQEKPFVSHQWEELVLLLSRDNDPHMREKMHREMDAILDKDPGSEIFKMY